MEIDSRLILFKELINLGYPDEISYEASRICFDLESAINYIYDKGFKFSDQKTNLHRDGSNTSSLGPKIIVPIVNPKIYGSNYEEHKSLENEDFYNFMAYCLRARGQDEETTSAICGLCTTKEEVLHNLNIPIFYKSVPFSEIPGHYILPEKDSEIIGEINSIDPSSSSIRKQWLLYQGVPETVADEYSVKYQNVDVALTILIEEMDLEPALTTSTYLKLLQQ